MKIARKERTAKGEATRIIMVSGLVQPVENTYLVRMNQLIMTPYLAGLIGIVSIPLGTG